MTKTNTPIADAYRLALATRRVDLTKGLDRVGHESWMLGARATLAQMKPFFDQYQFLRDKTEHGSLKELEASIRLDEVYDDVVEPLLKELEE